MSASEPIAIVGIGCRLPGAVGSPAQLWSLLVEGRDAIDAVPVDRWRAADGRGSWPSTLVAHGGFLDDVWGFDPAFFAISAREAEAMDPQQRLLLETTWEALEDAGVPPSTLAGSSTGVFVGLSSSDFGVWTRGAATMTRYVGCARNAAAARIAYALDLLGPTAVLDTDRSSSLVALDAACASLRNGDCDLAIVGSANLILDPSVSAALATAGMLAPDGRCKFADAAADGTVRSEGVVSIVLRPLSKALSNGDRIYALVRGGTVIASGKLAGDLVVPSLAAQERLLRRAYQRANVRPGDVVYVEGHGTGTPVGDLVELSALQRVIGECWVGSIKTNIGHCEACGGLAGVVKVALAAFHRQLPPSLHFERFPEGLASGLRVVTELVSLPDDAPLIAGVSSFGLTGINAHVVLEGPPPAPTRKADPPRDSVLCISAASDEALRMVAKKYAEHLRREPPPDRPCPVEDVCRSAAAHRDHLAHRAAFGVDARQSLVDELEAFARRGAFDTQFVTGRVGWRPTDLLVFVFPGQGSQWAGMGKALFAENEPFAARMRECDEVFREVAGRSLLDELERAEPSDEIDLVQPLLLAIEISLVAMWESWGVRPGAVVGTSMGEVAAACVAGALSIGDAFAIIHRRTRLMRRVAGGAMAVVELPVASILPRLDPRVVSIAASNSPSSTVISGERPAVEALVRAFDTEGVFAKLVRVDVASHSPKMEPILAELGAALHDVTPRCAAIPFFSTVEGARIDGERLDAAYWVKNLRAPIDLTSAIRALAQAHATVFVEMSPRSVLRSAIVDNLHEVGGDRERLALFTLDELRTSLGALGRLHTFGYPIAWDRVMGQGPFVPLPTYAWENRPHRIGSPPSDEGREDTDAAPVEAPSEHAPSAPTSPAHRSSLLDKLAETPAAARTAVLLEELAREAARIFSVSVGEIDVDRPLREHGLTSLSAMDLRATVGAWLGRHYPSSLLFNHPTLRALAERLAVDVQGQALPARPVVAERPRSPRRPVDLRSEPMAIVGMALRFPGGASSPEALWRLLDEGRHAITEIPPDRWDGARYYDPDVRTPGKMHTRWGAFVDDIATFDPELFSISPKEAESMDPQQRLLLQLTWEALEHAGTSRARVMGSPIGVFVGIMNTNEYSRRKSLDERLGNVTPHTSTGDATSIAAGRIAYTFGLHGPAISIDTACSSSLVALHLAIDSIRSGECSAAIVGGVNLIAYPTTTLSFAKTRMLSPSGRCRPFDARADGYVRGEGGCVIVVKPLADALTNGDHVLALIRGTALNQDGRGSGLTAPNGRAQESLIRRALAKARVEPSDVLYVEAHGTGTPLGDPIEMHALLEVFGASRAAENPLVVGSIKANLGHLESCAGLAGLAKVVLAMEHRRVPPQVGIEKLNPKLDLPPWITIPVDGVTLPEGRTIIASVSSFGFSGTNAHAVLEEPPPRPASSDPPSPSAPVVFCLSGNDPRALAEVARAYAAWPPMRDDAADLAALADSASRREHLSARLAVVARSTIEMRQKLDLLVSENALEGASYGTAGLPSDVFGPTVGVDPPKVAFLYSSAPALAAELRGLGACVASTAASREVLQRCEEIAGSHIDVSLAGLLAAEDDVHAARLSTPRCNAIARFAVQMALTAALESWGITPECVLGDGDAVGELAAACAAGVMDVGGALTLLLALTEPCDSPSEREAAVFRATQALALAAPIRRFVSSVAGNGSGEEVRTPEHWRSLVRGRERSRLGEAVAAVVATGSTLVLELGPRACSVREAAAVVAPSLRWLPSDDDLDPAHRIARTVAELYTSGADIAWDRWYAERACSYHPTPRYPFSRRTFWIAARAPDGA